MTPRLRLLLAAPLVTLAIVACTNQIHRKEETAQSARAVSGAIPATNQQIDATLESLRHLLTANPGELKPAFDQYAIDVTRTSTMALRIDGGAGDMRRQSQAYLGTWEKRHNEIQDPDLRRISEERRQTVMARFEVIGDAYDEAHNSLVQLLGNFEDVRTALRTDLTPAGVAAVANSNVVQNAEGNASHVKAAFQQVQSGTTAVAEALEPSTYANTREAGMSATATQ